MKIFTILPYILDITKEKVDVVVRNVKDAFRLRLKDKSISPWLDDEARAAALRKLDAMKDYLFLPEAARTNATLIQQLQQNIKLQQLSPTNKWKNILHMTASTNRLGYQRWTEDAYETAYYMSIDWTVVNAFYAMELNSLFLPMGLLHPHFFSPKTSLAFSYGFIGAILGHELTHGFDGLGVQYDEDGIPAQLFDTDTQNTYNDLTQCFAHFYNTYTVAGRAVDGLKTLDENIADQGGLQASWDAFSKVMNGIFEHRMPGLADISPEKMFWIGYSQLWCENTVDELSVLIQVSKISKL